MAAPTFEDVKAQLAQLMGPVDGDDPKTRKRRHILTVASECFARHGYRKTSMDDVARAAGVAKGTIYSYFANKIDLLIAAASLEKYHALERMRPVFDPARPAAERLREYLVQQLLLPREMPITTALLRGDQELAAVMAEMPPELMQQGTLDRHRLVGGLIDEAARPHAFTRSELDARADVLTGLAYLSTQLEHPHVRGDLSIERYAELLADLVVGGVLRAKGNE